MANENRESQEKRAEPPERRNGQGDAEGSAHSPEEFDALNPEKRKNPKENSR